LISLVGVDRGGVSASQDPESTESDAGDESGRIAQSLEAGEVRRRGAAAIFYVVSWGFGSLLISFLGSVALARMLSPSQFGLVAIGQTVIMLAGVVSEGGIASGFIRGAQGIARPVLRSVNCVQLIIGVTVAVLVSVVALNFGMVGELTALMIWSVPIAGLRTAGRVVLFRELRFRDVSVSDAFGVIAYYVWSISGVALGMGVWAMASGVLVRAAVETSAIATFTGWSLLVPSLRRYRDVLGVIGFGIRFSANWLANVLYQQAQNILFAVIGGVYSLGIWTLAMRILQLPNLIYTPLHQVAFPAFAQLVNSGEDPRPLLERVSSISFGISAIVLPSFLVSLPGLVPAVFGDQWADAVLLFPGLCLAIFIAAPIVAPCMYFLFAIDRPSVVVRATVIGGVAGLSAMAVLMWTVGLAGVAFGTVVTAVIESLVLARVVQKVTGAKVWATMPSLLTVGVVAAACGYAVGLALGYGVAAAIVASAAALAVSVAGCRIVQHEVLREIVHVARRSLGVVFGGQMTKTAETAQGT
jgi:PST family polysaccharide transporter